MHTIELDPDSSRMAKSPLQIFKNYLNKAPFTRDRIQMGSDPFGSDPLFERRLHGFGSRTVRVYTGSDPFGFYGFSAAL